MDIKVHEDISIAQQILSGFYLNIKPATFHNNSRIYRGTNECIYSVPYSNALKNKRRILSVIGSGDQIINSVLFGSTDISGYDISRFPKYYLMLKLAAIKSLSKDEYIEFFIGKLGDTLFNEETYDSIRVNLEDQSLLFWDSLFDYFDEYEISDSPLFSSDIINRQMFVNNNPYLDENNYDEVRNNLDMVKLTFYEGNIFDFFRKNKNCGKYNLINLSNIIQYPKKEYGTTYIEIYSNYKKFLKTLPLEEQGIALTYFFQFNEDILNSLFNEDCFSLERLGNEKKSGLLLYKRR